MFSEEITTSDAFLDMPGGSQLLYFHLGMQADDDGFIGSPKMVMRMLGASEDEYKILLAKKFVIHFQSGICVVKHWRINNQIRRDRYRETKHTYEKEQLFLRENGSYTINPDRAIPMPKGHFLTSGNQVATSRQPLGDAGKVREGKVRVDNNSGLPDWLDTEAWANWVQYRTDTRKKLTPQTVKLQLKLLGENIPTHKKIIETSIQNGWTGLFPIKSDTKRPDAPKEPSKYKNVKITEA
jgi:hypothetical protein